MKNFLSVLFSLLFLSPMLAMAAGLTLPQGGLGTTTVPTNYVLLGSDSLLRVTAVATSSLGLQNILQGTTGQVAYFSGTNTAVGTSTIFIAGNSFVGMGTTTPNRMLNIAGSTTAGTVAVQVRNFSSSDGASALGLFTNDINAGFNLQVFSSGTATSGVNIPNSGKFFTSGAATGGMVLGPTAASAPLIFISGGSTERMRLTADGFLGIASSSPGSLLSISGGNITQTASAPTIIGTASQTNVGRGLAVRGRYAYVIENTAASALEVFDVSAPASPVLVATLALSLGGSSYPVIAGNYLFVALTGTSNNLQVIDISNPVAPVLVKAITSEGAGSGRSLNISGRYLYYGDSLGRFIVYDISNPISPQLMSVTTLTNVASIWSISLQGSYAYVGEATTTAATAGLHILDISNPASPAVVSTYATKNSVRATEIMGRYLYIGEQTGGDLEIVDVKNPAVPVQAGTFTPAAVIGTAAQSMMPVLGNYLYWPGNTLMQVIDISNPAVPVSAGTVNTSSGANAEGMVPNGKYMYVSTAAAGASGFEVADISGALLPSASIGSLSTSYLTVNGRSSFASTIFAQGGLEVGNMGILSHGGLGVFIASTTQANPIAALFQGGSVQVANSLLVGTTSTSTVQSTFRLSSLTSIFGQVLGGVASAFNFGAASSTNFDSTGANFTFDASNGMGAGNSGDFIFRTAASSSPTTVTLDATSTKNGGTATITNLTWTHTIGASCVNPVLIISLSPGAARTYAASTTLSGNFTFLGSSTGSTANIYVMYITNPTVGAQTISVTQTDALSAQRIAASSVSYCNVNQTTPFGNVATTSTASATSISLTSSGGGQMIFDALGKTDNTENAVQGAGQTHIAATSTNQGTPSNNRQVANSQIQVNGANTTTSWSWATARAAAYMQIPLLSVNGATANTLTDRLHITSAGPIGMGTAVPTAVNANAHLTVAGTGSQDIIASTTDNNTLSDSVFNAYAPSMRIFMGAHGGAQVSTRYGLTLGGWGEITSMDNIGTSKGLVIGTSTSTPFVFGTSNLERARILSTGEFGIGTTSPWGLLSIVRSVNGSNNPLFVVATSTPTATSTAFMVTSAGHIIASSTTPVLSACGTSPTMLGSDAHGTVTTGATAGGCVVTFQVAYSAAPACVVTPQTGSVVNTFSYAVSATAITVTEVGLGGGKFDYICRGVSGTQ